MQKWQMKVMSASELTDVQWLDFGRLMNEAFPKDNVTDFERAALCRGKICEDTEFVLVYGESLLASAVSFPRMILTAQGHLTVLALASVAVKKSERGKGLGAMVVCKAFERVDNGDYPVALFQTSVDGFYCKLGCREIDNRMVNSLAKDKTANPFWDKHIMIYPSEYGWPEGDIDILGAGY